MAIRANESISLGATIGPSESNELYDCFFKALVSLSVSEREIRERPIMSHQHSSLSSMCSSCKYFLCLRQLVEACGTNSFLGKIAHRTAFTSAQKAFVAEIAAASYDTLELDKLHALDAQGLMRHRLHTYCDTSDNSTGTEFLISAEAGTSTRQSEMRP
jgi:hypothetical protein